MASSGRDRKNSPLIIFVWVLLAIICIQGYFILTRKSVEVKPVKVQGSVVPVVTRKPVKPVLAKQPFVKKPGESTRRIAVVIDDWGYNDSHCKYLAMMPRPAGIAILPGLQYSQEIIKCALDNGKQPMLHLPLEPYNHKEMFDKEYVLTTAMSASALKATISRVMDEMKGVVGVNNHTGSKGSESELVVSTVLSEVKSRGLFFVDSVTSERSLFGNVAARLKMHIARRDVFLDNRNERVAIEQQFAEAAKIARINGFALVIGHDRVLSLQIIIEQMKKLSSEGYDFVSVPEYIKKNEYPRY
jgi:hypothetical protein